MDTNFGGADYKNEHRLVFGNESFINDGKTNYNFEIYNYSYNKDIKHRREEIEAFLIANDIKNKIENHYQIMDSKNKCLRDICYNDICILMDRGTNFDLYKKIFTFMGIPLSVYKDDSVASSSNILVIKNLLKLIHCIKKNEFNEEFKYAFMSVGRSFLSSYNDNDLFK